jgi:hypothetical protein
MIKRLLTNVDEYTRHTYMWNEEMLSKFSILSFLSFKMQQDTNSKCEKGERKL